MVENFIEKGLSFYSRKFGKRSRPNYRPIEEVNARIEQFGLKRVAVLIDELTDFSGLAAVNASVAAVYSFALGTIGTLWEGHQVQPLVPGATPEVDGWVISAGNPFAGYSLNRYLLDQGREGQVIVKHVNYVDGTRYYSYIDFFTNEQRTLVQLHNYFRRCYSIPFPLDLQLTLRDGAGKVLETKQIILAPDETRALTSDDFSSRDFAGYLEVEFDVSSRVNKFLHYYATYSSRDFISTNHQSGLGLHPAHSSFTRGFVPVDPEETLVICLFQKDYAAAVTTRALLEYQEGGLLRTVERELKPVARHEMHFLDVKKVFPELDFSRLQAPMVRIYCAVPLHRPNYYYARTGSAGYYDISHAGPDPKGYIASFGGASIPKERQQKLASLGCSALDLRHFVLPESSGIESLLGLAGDSTVPVKDFRFQFRRQDGSVAASFEQRFDYEQQRFVNLNELLASHGVTGFSGTVSVGSAADTGEVPVIFNGISGYRHVRRGYLTTTAASGGNPDNIPFYFPSAPPNYLGGDCAAGVTDIYGPGLCDEEYDTYFCLTYPCADQSLAQTVPYEVQILNTQGRSKTVSRTIAAGGTDLFRLSELFSAEELPTERGSYVVWCFTGAAHLYGQRILLRKSDDAISVEHLYPGKFGI
jgi:hypothetical protein